MSPAPAANDPGDDSDRDEVQPGDIPVANLMALVDSSTDEDEMENVAPGIGYQLLTPGMDLPGPAGPGDSDDDDDGGSDDDHHDSGTEADANVEEMLSNGQNEDQASSRTLPHLQVPSLGENTEIQELKELWKTPRIDVEPTPMDQDQVDTIKSAMAGFSLPPSSLPLWATVVPETEWKAQLLSRLDPGKCVAKTTDSRCKKSAVGCNPTLDRNPCLETSAETVSQESETAAEPNCCTEGGGLSK